MERKNNWLKLGKVVFTFALLCVLSLSAFCQNKDPQALKILTSVSNRYKQMKAYSIDFTKKVEGVSASLATPAIKGKLWVQGEKFRLESDEQTLICNGKTLWNINSESKEVSVYEYNANEEELNPKNIYDLYKSGYKYLLLFQAKKDKKGGIAQTIELEPEDRKKPISKVRMVVHQPNNRLYSWIIFEKGSNVKNSFTVTKETNLASIEASKFEFSKAAFPNYKIIDLR